MAKFNTQGCIPGKTTNVAGGVSYERSDMRQEIAAQVLTALMSGKDRYYETEQGLYDRLMNLFGVACEEGCAEFLAKAMVYTRTKGNLRSITHMMAVALAEYAPRIGEVNLRRAFNKAVVRPDDMTEVVALWNSRHPNKKVSGHGMMIPNSLRKAYRDVLESERFGAFHYKRYSGNGKVKIKDIVLITRPRESKREDTTLFKAILDDTLPNIETMETLRSVSVTTESGDESDTKTKDAFSKLLNDGKLGYMAAIKNIRNALVEGLSDADIDKWCALVSDPNKVRHSKILPFRFYTAWKELRGIYISQFTLAKIETAIEAALTASVANIELVKPEEKVAVVIDDSGSMNSAKINQSTSVFEAACVMAGLLIKTLPRGNVRVYMFGEECRDVTENFENSILRFIGRCKAESGNTLVHLPFEKLMQTRTVVDKIFMLTDGQIYSFVVHRSYLKVTEELKKYFDAYRNQISPNARFMFWTMLAYEGGTPMKLSGDIMEVCGFSDKLFELVPKFWNDKNALVNEIEAIEL